MIKFNKNLEGNKQSDQENGGSCAKLSNLFNPKARNIFLSFIIFLCLTSCQSLESDPVHSEPKILKDIPYGKDIRNTMNVYLPPQDKNSPVIFMVHGGAWWTGDKAYKSVVENKVNRWVTRGFIFISANYRLLPKADPLQQAADVARALAVAQNNAPHWGGDASKFVLMGHSAGSHLVAVLSASPSIALDLGAKPWLGSVLIDSGALDVVKIMKRAHFRLYDNAFGSDIAYWKSVSPFHLLKTAQSPFLAICSTKREDDPCSQATEFVKKASSLGMRANVLKVNMSHRDTNIQLGKDLDYTEAVELFLATLDKSIKQLLTKS